MKKTLFITGITGFLGQYLLKSLKLEDYAHIYCIARRENKLISKLSRYDNFTFYRADLFETHLYSKCLAMVDCVVHLAAITGKAKPQDYFRVNAEGTEVLTKLCRKYNVSQFILISSIAVKFKNLEFYHYAQSKIAAESMVKNSNIQFVIVRPTMIIGKNAPVLKSLRTLAMAPLVPVFGDGNTRIQPIYVDDLVRLICNIIKSPKFKNEAIEAGGSEVVTMEAFLSKINDHAFKKKFRTIHIPTGQLAKGLNILEKFFLKWLPFTAGQLSSFTNDGLADMQTSVQNEHHPFQTIDEMLKISLEKEQPVDDYADRLTHECHALTRYLMDASPDQYICKKYIQGHLTVHIDKGATFFDRLLVKVAVVHPVLTKFIDAYVSILYRKAVLRKKMVLLLSILESYAPTYSRLDTADVESKLSLFYKMAWKVTVFLCALIVSVVTLGPIHLVARVRS